MGQKADGTYVDDGLPDEPVAQEPAAGELPTTDPGQDAGQPADDGMGPSSAPELHPAWTPETGAWQNQGSASHSYSGVDASHVAALDKLGPAFGLLGDQANADAGLQQQHAEQAAASAQDIANQDAALRFARAKAERDAQQAEIDLQNQFALDQQHHGQVALAASQAARAKMQQDVLALSHMEINPAAGNDAASNTVSTVALFAQGFLAARYGIQTNAQGVLDSWVNRTVQMQQDKIARGEKLVQSDQVMWDMARSEAIDQQDELTRVQALLLGRAKAQTALTGSMFLGDAAKLDVAKQTAAIDNALNSAYDTIAQTRYQAHASILKSKLETAAQAAAAARTSSSSSSSWGATPIPTSTAAPNPLILYDGDVDHPRAAGAFLPGLDKDKNAIAAKAKWDTTRTTADLVMSISKQLANGVKSPELIRRWAGEHSGVLSATYNLLQAALIGNNAEKVRGGDKLLAVFDTAMGGNIDNLTVDDLALAGRTIMHFGATQIRNADYAVQSYTTPGTHLNPEQRKMFDAGFEALPVETTINEHLAGLARRGKQDDRETVAPTDLDKEIWGSVDQRAIYRALGAPEQVVIAGSATLPERLPAATRDVTDLYMTAKGGGPDARDATEKLRALMTDEDVDPGTQSWAVALGTKLGLSPTTAIAPPVDEPVYTPSQTTARDRGPGK